MSQLISPKCATTSQRKSNLGNIRGTFAVEGMSINRSTRRNLDRIASWKTPQSPAVTAPLLGEPQQPPLKGEVARSAGGVSLP